MDSKGAVRFGCRSCHDVDGPMQPSSAKYSNDPRIYPAHVQHGSVRTRFFHTINKNIALFVLCYYLNRIETTPVLSNEPDVGRSERDIESSQSLEDYVLPRFGFAALNNFLLSPATVTVTVSISASYTFSTTVVPKTVN